MPMYMIQMTHINEIIAFEQFQNLIGKQRVYI